MRPPGNIFIEVDGCLRFEALKTSRIVQTCLTICGIVHLRLVESNISSQRLIALTAHKPAVSDPSKPLEINLHAPR